MDLILIPIDKNNERQSVAMLLSSFHISDKKIKALETANALFLNGKNVSLTEPLFLGDNLEIDIVSEEKLDYLPEARNIECLYEDDWVYVLNKPAGIIIHPEFKTETGTLANIAANFLKVRNIDRQVRYLHRLDKDTTGAILFAKHFLAHSYLDYHWNHIDVLREYLALIEGRMDKPQGRIDFPIGKDRHQNNKYIVYRGGKNAVTRYEVVNEYGSYSLVRLRLETGRTHQIRVHMSYFGYPLLGDKIYGATGSYSGRILLHSSKISFIHPLTKNIVEVSCPLPEDFQERLK